MKKIGIISIIIILIDQIIKLVVSCNMKIAESITIITNFFRITHLQNKGGAWSIFNGNIPLLIIITIIILSLVFYIIYKNNKIKKVDNFYIIIYSLLIGGILGNLIDRIRLGAVVDYLDFNFGSYNYPVFNLADICIVIACIILMLKIIKEGE